MLKTSYNDMAVSVNYDGYEFSVIPYAINCIGVMCKRRGEWDYYESKPYKTFAEACEAIFFGTILVDRTERGHLYTDENGDIRFRPLSYYES